MTFHFSAKLVASGGVVLAALAGGLWWSQRAPAAAPIAVTPTAVSVARVRSGTVPVEMDGIGHVQAYNTVNVMPQVSGQVVKVAFAEGQAVKVGDLLVQIDPRSYQDKLDQDKADLAKDTAHRNNAQVNLARYQTLAESGAIAAQQVDSQASQFAQLQATLLADQAQISQDALALSYTSITAPIGGVAGFRDVDVGNLVAPGGSQPLLTITQVQPIAVLFTLPQTDLPTIQARSASGALAVEAWSQDGGTKLDTGTLESTDNKVDPASGTITLKAVFTNPGNRLWPGQFVQARLIVEQLPHALTIPASAVQRGAANIFVWVVTPARTAQIRAVTVAQSVHGTALISAGLKPGEEVVTDGQYGLQPGTPVKPVAASAPLLKNTQPGTLGIAP